MPSEAAAVVVVPQERQRWEKEKAELKADLKKARDQLRDTKAGQPHVAMHLTTAALRLRCGCR